MMEYKTFEEGYKAFEDEFRGPQELIRERLALYLPLLEQIDAPNPNGHRALDLGSGRGEWLELVGDRGWSGVGVEPNPGMAEAAREKGIDCRNEDALGFLKSQSDGSFGLVTAFHVVEHLDVDYLMEVLNEISRVLIPGGLTIQETPNPENLSVASWSFYMDPTHVRPLPPNLLRFLNQQSGLQDAHILRLNGPVPAANAGPLESSFNALFSASPDYAIVARKRGEASPSGFIEEFIQANSQPHPSDFAFLANNSRTIDSTLSATAADTAETKQRLAELLAKVRHLTKQSDRRIAELEAKAAHLANETQHLNARLLEAKASLDHFQANSLSVTLARYLRRIRTLLGRSG